MSDDSSQFADAVQNATDDAVDAVQNTAADVANTVQTATADAVDTAQQTARQVTRKAQDAGWDPIRLAHQLGIRSSWAYIGGFASIGLALASWTLSRLNPTDDKAQSDRWGIFIGHWAPTFFAIGLALKDEERS